VSLLRLSIMNLSRLEIVASIIAVLAVVFSGVSYVIDGAEPWSLEVIVLMILLAFYLQSIAVVGIVRARSRVMNMLFVDVLKELADTKIRINEEISEDIMKRISVFVGGTK